MELAVAPAQLRADLRGEFHGRLVDDPITRNLYATDASAFQLMPALIAVPRDEADVQVLLRYCYENAIPVVPRGAGTGLAGESLGTGVTVDLTEGFRSIRKIDGNTVIVEPGVTLAELNTALASIGRRFAPDSSSGAVCTLGGMIANNASGGNAYRYGYTRDHVRSLRVVWDTGNRAHISSPQVQAAPPLGHPAGHPLGHPAGHPLGHLPELGTGELPRTAEDGLRIAELRSQTATLLTQNRDLVQHVRPATRFNRCGYMLHDVLTSAGLDLTRLLTGSEGTLGIITEATLKTIPLPGAVCQTVLGFPTLDQALRAGLLLRTTAGIVTCELLDPRQLAFSRSRRSARTALDSLSVPSTIGAALVVSFEADSERDALRFCRTALDRVREFHQFVQLAEPTCEPEQLARIARFRQIVVSGLYSLGSGPRPVAALEDIGVPAEELPRFLSEIQRLLRNYDCAASYLVHVLTGQVHTRPFVDLANPADRAKLWAIAEEAHTLAVRLGGTISTQHGTGLARTPWVEKQYGPLLSVFRELKQIFDPKGILNPGKILGPDPRFPAWPFRTSVLPPAPEQVAPSEEAMSSPSSASPSSSEEPTPAPTPTTARRVPLLMGPESWAESAASTCNGCGDCRTRTPPTRMCPVFRALGTEAATPRAKANLFRHMLSAGQDGTPLSFHDFREVADLCVNCKMCRQECRAGVDVPKMMLEAKAQDHAERGFERTDWMLARVEMLSALAGNFAFTTNTLLGNWPTRWLMDKLFGLSRHRTLPRFTHRTFLRRARRAGLTNRARRGQGVEMLGLSPRDSTFPIAPRLAYFVDTYANYNDPLIAEATVAVLRYHGFHVHVPRRQKGSGIPAFAAGDAETAREVAAHNIRILADLVRDGYTVVCSDPTAALALTQDYLDLVDDPDTRLVAGHTIELTALLWQLHEAGRLHRGFRPLSLDLGHHVPCHMKALRAGTPAGPRLLELIPGVRVHTIDKSCSGMAGVWGLKSGNFAMSLAAGQPMIDAMNQPRVLFGSTECGSCRLQMQQGSGKRTLHPIQYLALAYGLLPELEARLLRPLGTLITD